MKALKKTTFILALSLAAFALAGCWTDADIASRNLSKAAEMFEINRRVVFINVMTGEYILSVEGLCSVEDSGYKVALVCRTGPSALKKHQMGRTETVTYFSEQLEPSGVSAYHYRVIFKPQSIIPDIDLAASTEG